MMIQISVYNILLNYLGGGVKYYLCPSKNCQGGKCPPCHPQLRHCLQDFFDFPSIGYIHYDCRYINIDDFNTEFPYNTVVGSLIVFLITTVVVVV